MNRRSMLHGFSALGLGALLPFGKTARGGVMEPSGQSSGCFLTPQETAGPYYFNPNLVRQDIRSDSDTGDVKTGLPLTMVFTVIDAACNPIPNVLVDIWHADKDGVYSGYAGQPGGVSTVGLDFLRGIQPTDAEGKCTFLSIYPGWYPGRVTHVHFKVRLTSSTYVTSQFAFPDATNTEVYGTPLYAARGQNSLTNANDSIFRSPNPEHLLMATTSNGSTGGYDGTLTIGINVPAAVPDAGAQPEGFALFQNFPNPFNPSTTIRYQLPSSSHVKLAIYDVFGREAAVLIDSAQPAGLHEATWDGSGFGSGFYYCRLYAGGTVQVREMLLLK